MARKAGRGDPYRYNRLQNRTTCNGLKRFPDSVPEEPAHNILPVDVGEERDVEKEDHADSAGPPVRPSRNCFA